MYSSLSEVEIIKIKWLSPEVYELCCSRPASYTFVAGQYVSLFSGDVSREYTILSAEQDKDLRFLIRLHHGGHFSPTVAQLKPGNILKISEPQGYFVHRVTNNKRVFIATGTGIAPFVSMFTTGAKADILLYGVRNASNLLYKEILVSAVEKFIPCFSASEQDNDDQQSFFAGYVTHYLEKILPDGVYDFYLCGNGPMIRDALFIIDDKYPESSTFSEFYN